MRVKQRMVFVGTDVAVGTGTLTDKANVHLFHQVGPEHEVQLLRAVVQVVSLPTLLARLIRKGGTRRYSIRCVCQRRGMRRAELSCTVLVDTRSLK